jgi:type II secretory pathway pseudopilin PulG
MKGAQTMKKLEKIDRQEQQTREKIAALQSLLKQIDGARTEQENFQIIQQFRSLKLSKDELYAFLGGGVLPPVLTGAIIGNTEPPQTIHSRRGGTRRNEPEITETPDADTENTDNESEDLNNEEKKNYVRDFIHCNSTCRRH